MKVFRIRVSREVAIQLDHFGDPLPTRKGVLSILAEFRTKPIDTWPASAFLGLLIEQYELRYKRKWIYSVQDNISTRNDLRQLLTRVGPVELNKGLRVLYTHPKLRWISSGHLRFLFDRKKYLDYIRPVLEEQRQNSGEQSEWTSGFIEKSRTMTPNEFFGTGGEPRR